jgi:hypothetical protein
MTTEHVLYIPTIFFIGFLIGKLTAATQTDQNAPTDNKLIKGSLVITSFILFAVVFAVTHFFELPASSKAVSRALDGAQIFDKSPSFSSNEVYQRMSHFPAAGIYLYKRFTHSIDIIFPLSFFLFLILLSKLLIQRLQVKPIIIPILTALPIIWLGCDLVENGIIYYLLNDFPERHNLLAGILGYLTITKFAFLLLSVAMPALTSTFKRFRLVNAVS